MHERCDPEKSRVLYLGQCSRDVVVAISDEREMVGMILSGGKLLAVILIQNGVHSPRKLGVPENNYRNWPVFIGTH